MNWRKIPSYVSLFLAIECQLIFLVKQRPILYDINHALFFDSERKRQAWNTIQHKIGKSRKWCMEKWRILKDGYMYRERFRELGIEYPYTSAAGFLNKFARYETYGDSGCSFQFLLKLNPVLYDTSHGLFHDLDAGMATWRKINRHLGGQGDWCMTRRAFLKKWYIKRKRLSETGLGWPYMNATRFRDPFTPGVFEQLAAAAMVTPELSEEYFGNDEQGYSTSSNDLTNVVALVVCIIWLFLLYVQFRLLFAST